MAGHPLPRAHCYRCLYSWLPRHPTVRMCPRCKSRLWNVPKIRRVKLGHGLGVEEVIAPHQAGILRLARKYGAKELRAFGSIRRREGRQDSAVDLLVRWSRRRPPMAWLDRPIQLEDLLGRRVDLVAAEALHWAVRPQVEDEAVPV